MTNSGLSYHLIVTIVRKGDAEDVVDCAKKAGAEGGTILTGRGTGIHETIKIFGIPYEPEKEVVLTLVQKKISEQVLQAIYQGVRLEQPSRGIVFMLDVEKVLGICHAENSPCNQDNQ
ncbi:MAG: P-II family nitrogen regulator [Christensenellales bacterium]|jgi:nitrogen regulatory protein PII